jgi:hypothetical protein
VRTDHIHKSTPRVKRPSFVVCDARPDCVQDHGVEALVREDIDAELLEDFDRRDDGFGESEDVNVAAVREGLKACDQRVIKRVIRRSRLNAGCEESKHEKNAERRSIVCQTGSRSLEPGEVLTAKGDVVGNEGKVVAFW